MVWVETVRVETVRVETIRIKTVRVETVRVKTVRVETVEDSNEFTLIPSHIGKILNSFSSRNLKDFMLNSNSNSIVNQTHENWNLDSNSIKLCEPDILRYGIQIPISLFH
ncbi:hypothetical protein Hanom_Chr08g00744051 [Helianthus anomalus]